VQAKFAQTGEQTYYHDFVRNIVSKYVGEEQAKEADSHPFQQIPPNEIAAIYKVRWILLPTPLSVFGYPLVVHMIAATCKFLLLFLSCLPPPPPPCGPLSWMRISVVAWES